MPNDTPTAYDLWQNQVSIDVTRAQNTVNNVENAFQNATIQLCAAMQVASTEYDSIMKAEASKSLFEGLFIGIILDVLPGLKVFSALNKSLGIYHTTERIKKLNETYATYVSIGKDVRDRVKQSIDDSKENKGKQDEASAIQEQLNSRNETAKKAYSDQLELLNEVSYLARTSRSFIGQRQVALLEQEDKNLNIRSKIESDFEEYGLQNNEVGGRAFLNLSDKMLYAMLKNYVAKYVVIYIDDTQFVNTASRQNGLFGWEQNSRESISEAAENYQYNLDAKALRTMRINDLPQNRSDSFIKGLDLEKRTKIYEGFPRGLGLPSVTGGDDYPKVNSYKDFIKHWNAKTVGTSGRNLRFL